VFIFCSNLSNKGICYKKITADNEFIFKNQLAENVELITEKMTTSEILDDTYHNNDSIKEIIIWFIYT